MTLTPAVAAATPSRYLIVPCEAEPDLSVIWDRQESQVVDVITSAEAARWDADAL